MSIKNRTSSKVQSLEEGIDLIQNKILIVRGKKVMLDRDLAELFGVQTRYLNRQVRRNIKRFPDEFMFQLTVTEKDELVTNWHRFNSLKHSTSLPFAFTEHGAVMLASVLNSPRAVQASIYVVRAFVRLRELLSTHEELAQMLSELEKKAGKHDKAIQTIVETLRQLLQPPDTRAPREKPKRRIGFDVKERKRHYGRE